MLRPVFPKRECFECIACSDGARLCYVDGARLSSAATNWPVVHPRMIYEYTEARWITPNAVVE
jgi:hypothetical protein